MVSSSEARPNWPERAVALPLLGALALLAVLAWIVTAWQASDGTALMTAGVPMGPGMTGRLGAVSAVLFLLVWLAMMAAMMFPSVWPVVLLYAAVARRQVGRGRVALFVAGYLLVWEGVGLFAYAAYLGVGALAASSTVAAGWVPVGVGAAVVVAGLYQLTPLKRLCLAHCQGPLGYLVGHWRGGAAGALRMGLGHGAYCLGCCWGLMLVLLALGAMDLRWMATAASLIALEKLGPRHQALPRLIGVGLLLLGAAILLGRSPWQ